MIEVSQYKQKLKMLRREVLRKQARNMVYCVHSYMAKEAEEGVRNVKQIQQRTAEATQTCVATVRRIVKETKANEDKSKMLKTPGKKRLKRKRVTGLDNSELGSIKRYIHTFHLTHNEFPTVNKLLYEFRRNFNFKGSEGSIRRVVRRIGFRFKRTENKNRILIERSNVRLKRIEYLGRLKKYLQQGRHIVFSDELYLERTMEQKAISKSQRIIILHAGSETGFIPNALMVAESDGHSNISDDVYYDWLQHQLIPNLPSRSVLVVDNSSPHDKEHDPAPNSNAKRSDMQAWLDQKGIHYTPAMYKPQLYQLINDNKGRFKILTLDKMLTDHGHDILLIPPNHPDLNPIELAWASIKTHVNSNTKEFNVSKIIDLVKEKVNAIGPEEWKKMCREVRKIEDIYRNNEHIIDTLSESIIAGDQDSSSESEGSDTSLSSDEDK